VKPNLERNCPIDGFTTRRVTGTILLLTSTKPWLPAGHECRLLHRPLRHEITCLTIHFTEIYLEFNIPFCMADTNFYWKDNNIPVFKPICSYFVKYARSWKVAHIGNLEAWAMFMLSSIFCDITPCSPLKVIRRFGGIFCLSLQGRISQARNQHGAGRNKSKRINSAGDMTRHNHCCENLTMLCTEFYTMGHFQYKFLTSIWSS
jgi:hypothetical protein